MKTKIIFLLILMALLLQCDPYYKHIHIPKSLTTTLRSRDTLLYQDRITKRTDTFLIDVNNVYVIMDKTKTEKINITYIQINKRKTFNDLLSSQSTDTNSFSFWAINYTYNFKTERHVQDITIGSYNYTDVFVATTERKVDTVPVNIYYTFKQGLLRYDYADGRQFERIKK